MKLYSYIYYNVYTLLKKYFRSGREVYDVPAIILITFTELANYVGASLLCKRLPNILMFLTLFLVLFVFNMILFLYFRKYSEIASDFSQEPTSKAKIFRILSLSYFIISIFILVIGIKHF
jgi:hypothetical protein